MTLMARLGNYFHAVGAPATVLLPSDVCILLDEFGASFGLDESEPIFLKKVAPFLKKSAAASLKGFGAAPPLC
jgi:hypothetical protein